MFKDMGYVFGKCCAEYCRADATTQVRMRSTGTSSAQHFPYTRYDLTLLISFILNNVFLTSGIHPNGYYVRLKQNSPFGELLHSLFNFSITPDTLFPHVSLLYLAGAFCLLFFLALLSCDLLPCLLLCRDLLHLLKCRDLVS
jgi:hypothetical protein